MIIPTSFVLGGTTWTVEAADQLLGALGASYPQEAKSKTF